MKKQRIALLPFLGVALLVMAFAVQLLTAGSASAAAQITTRKLTLKAGATPGNGGSKPSGVVNHEFSFTLPSNATIGSVKFQYCTTAADTGALTCQLPTGTSTAGSSLSSQSGISGFTVAGSSPNGTLILTRSAASFAGGAVVFQFDNVTNPSDRGTFFVRISTHASTDGTGAAVDSGTVAASTNYAIELEGTMPESLVFCTGRTVSKTATTPQVPDCTTATSGEIEFDRLFSPEDTATSSSQMAASTNAGFGYAITVHGGTLTSGSNTIAGMPATDILKEGVAQFGLNLVANTTTMSVATGTPAALGANIDIASNGTNYNGRAFTGYATADSFKFNTGDVVADSNFNASANPIGTDSQIYTVSYIANVPGSQPAGTYTTTLTYICTPTF